MGIVLHEVGMRDGLQVEAALVPLARKIAWIEQLMASGIDAVQVGSFVNPAVMPQMSDTDAIVRHFANGGSRGVRLSALVLNEKGLERGLAAGVADFCMGVSASEAHSRKNTGMSIADATTRILRMARTAADAGAAVQLSVQSAFGCGFEGRIPPARVMKIASGFIDAGFEVISLADTAGHATPPQVHALFAALRRAAPRAVLACHFHDTYGFAMANACAALEAGVQSFESAFGGLGGCPFTALAGGNLCTEDFVQLLQRSGLRRDVKLEPIIEVAREAETFFARPLPGAVHRTGTIPWQ